MAFLGNRELRTWHASLGLGFLIERKQKLLKGFKHGGGGGVLHLGKLLWQLRFCAYIFL